MRSEAKKRPSKAQSRRTRARSAPRPRRPREIEIVGMRCRVVEIHQDAEVLVLKEAASGHQFGVPLTSRDHAGRLIADVAYLASKDVWLSLRLL